MPQEKKDKINEIIAAKEKNNNKLADELKQAIAQYQGQATIGKIVNVILHEGRKPLGYFKNQIPQIAEWRDEIRKSYDQELFDKIVDRLHTLNEQSNLFINLFSKLDPLSSKKRDIKKDFNLKSVIENVKLVFQAELVSLGIDYIIDCTDHLTCYGWKEDLYIVLTNLVDNSIYWLQQSNLPKLISFKVYEEDNFLVIEYRDSGPGIEKELIESEVIFEPEFSGKTGGGTGLGLAIAGEAIERNNGKLFAIYSEQGAFFKVQIEIE